MLGSPEARRAAARLEYPRLLGLVAEHASLARGAATVRASEPLADEDALRQLWRRVDELGALLARDHDLPLGDMADLEELLGDERPRRGPLAPEELAATGAAALDLAVLLEAVARFHQQLPLLHSRLRGHENPRALGEHLRAALEPDGRIRDSASPKLAGLRQAAQQQESRLRAVARDQLSRAVDRGASRGGELVLRGDRFCIPVRSGSRREVAGVVHDRSSTGQTLFIEPLEVVEAGNDLAEARIAVADEEARILAALNQEVGKRRPALLALFHDAVQLDALRARARYGRACEGHAPRLARGGALVLHDFRHPLLEASLAANGRREALVPLSLQREEAAGVLLVSGPNAGGKTVALKAVGLAALMAQSGIPLPSREPCTLPVFDRVLLDVGDDQSIDDALSSFSAHMTHVGAVLREATADSLVLLDELGGGTDPQEGVALARAVLEELASRGGHVLATTHYGQLKVLVEEDPDRFTNASMEYDHERLRPRFRLVVGQPGSSHALEIARRLELPPAVLERARALVGDDTLLLERLLRELEEDRRAAAEARVDVEAARAQLRAEKKRYEEMAAELKRTRREKLAAANDQAEGIVRGARREVERLLERLQEAGAGEAAREEARAARAAIEDRAQKLRASRPSTAPARREQAPATLEEGGLARHVGLGQVGRILELRGDEVLLELGGRKLRARADQLVRPAPGEEPARAPGRGGGVRTDVGETARKLEPEVDVRGLDAQEAWREVDRALDRLLLGDARELRIIHGKGTGRLRRTLAARLAEDPRVAQASLGGGGRYDDGVTVARV